MPRKKPNMSKSISLKSATGVVFICREIDIFHRPTVDRESEKGLRVVGGLRAMGGVSMMVEASTIGLVNVEGRVGLIGGINVANGVRTD